MSYLFIDDVLTANFNAGGAISTGNFQHSTNVNDVIIACAYWGGESVDTGVTFTDTLGNVWHPFTNHAFDPVNLVSLYGAWTQSTSSGANQVTATPANAASISFRTVYAGKYSGLIGTSLGDTSNEIDAPGNAVNAIVSSNVNISTQPAIYWTVCIDQGANQTPTPGTSPTAFTGRPNTSVRLCAADARFTATGNAHATWTAPGTTGADNFQVLSISFAEGTPFVNKPFKFYSNGAIQANVFSQSVALPPSVVVRLLANNVFQANGTIVQNGAGKVSFLANGQVICNNTIVV
jgi:hypothetical protein